MTKLAKYGKILAKLPLMGSSDGATFNPATIEAFSAEGNVTLTVVKKETPATLEVEQGLTNHDERNSHHRARHEDRPFVQDVARAHSPRPRRSRFRRMAGPEWERPCREVRDRLHRLKIGDGDRTHGILHHYSEHFLVVRDTLLRCAAPDDRPCDRASRVLMTVAFLVGWLNTNTRSLNASNRMLPGRVPPRCPSTSSMSLCRT